MIRNVSAVTGACLMTRADVFHSVGGFNEDFPLNYSDIDYCLKVVGTGRRIVYTPWFWWPIMMIIRHLPWFVFRRLKI